MGIYCRICGDETTGAFYRVEIACKCKPGIL